MKMHYAVILVLGAVVSSLGAPARADAIDGHWCHKDGRRMSVEGPVIVTPGGTSMEGEYERHGFAYVVPEGEPGARSRVSMALQSEDVMRMFIPGKGPLPSPPTVETWQRCNLTM
ncbi:MAG: hypothetical protein ACTSP0_03020 [Alphaproteobacteria bacterium]